jgi:hypothetical protein
MGFLTPTRVELLYSIQPDILKPSVEVQEKIAALVKQEGLARAIRGESLTFRHSVAGLFDVVVTPAGEEVSLPRKPGRLDIVVKRKGTHTGSQALAKQVEQFLHTETIYPDKEVQQRFDRLVGLEREKALAVQMLCHFFCPEDDLAWGRKHHFEPLVEHLHSEPAYPVLVFEGPPGLGKTELARTIGDPLARALGIPVVSFRVSLTLRGHGLVGEITQNIAALIEFAKLYQLENGCLCLLQLDEAEAIAQKRDGVNPQHHEDQAAVNALLEGIDKLRFTPGVGIIFTTNMHSALDDAVKKRTNAQWITFSLPPYGERFYLFRRFLFPSFSAPELRQLASSTEGFAPRDIVEVCRAAFYKARSEDAPLTLPLLLTEIAILNASAAKERTGNNVSLKIDPQLLQVEPRKRVNGQRAKKTAA